MNIKTAIIWFEKGGIFMWPILIASVLCIAVIMEKWFVIKRFKHDFQDILDQLKDCLPEKSSLVITDVNNPYHLFIKEYLSLVDLPQEVRVMCVQNLGNSILDIVNKRVSMLASIATVSPLLGLLGTVTGLVLAFYQIQLHGSAISPSDLAGGIWQALITTVFGLSVGIVALIAHQVIKAEYNRVKDTLEEISAKLERSLAESAIKRDKRSERGIV